MIFVSHRLPVNTDGEPRLTQADVWAGLVHEGQQRAAVRAEHDLV